MEKMTVTRALAELKLLDARINKAINNQSFFVDVFQKKTESGNKALVSGMNKLEFEAKANSNYQSIIDLIDRRNKIKSARNKSNALTTVTIGKKEYTIVDVIDQKNAIVYKKNLLSTMRNQLNTINQKIEKQRITVESQTEAMLTQNLGVNKKATDKDYETIAQPFIEVSEFKLIDPLKLQDKIDELDKEIDEFESEVDFILSESNSRTEIEF
jgi:hypothetical protein